MKNIVLLLLVSSIFVFIFSCSDNKGSFQEDFISCSDGLQNGDETAIDCGGSCPSICPTPNSLQGVIVINTTLDDFDEYILTGPLLIRDKTTLFIPKGVTIKALPNKNAYIAVNQGGRIVIDGTKEEPVIFTSAAEIPVAGDWGGLLLCGFAPVNTGINSKTEIANYFYGGEDENDSSGSIRFLRIEYTGATAENEKLFNAISFFGVGKNTRLENIQVFESLGEGFKFFGGSANANWLMATNVLKSGISITDGWNGTSNFNYISGTNSVGIRIANNTTLQNVSPKTNATLTAISLVGSFNNGAFLFTDGGGGANITNVFTSNVNVAFQITGQNAIESVNADNFKINGIEFFNKPPNFSITNYMGSNPQFYQEAISIGAGNKENLPEWANGWTNGF